MVLLLVGLLHSGTTILAQPTSTNSINFQGSFTWIYWLPLPHGRYKLPLPNGHYDLTLKFYDALNSPNPIGVTNVSSVTVTGGIASTPIPVDAGWFKGQTRYLGISVNRDPELAARVLITSAPYALRASSAESLVVPGLVQVAVGVASNGFVGVGTANPAAPLHVEGGGFFGADAEPLAKNAGAGVRVFYHASIGAGQIYSVDEFGQPRNLILQGDGGNVGSGTNSPHAALHVAGTVRMKVCQINDGQDLTEEFDVTSDTSGTAIIPGMVTVIDREHDGKLVLCARAYDTAVAGVISGANGLSPGLVMKAEGQPQADDEQPLAMAGRVWCWVDASSSTGGGPVKRGDRLTTSAPFGHAMKVADESKAPGAVIGKAMTELPEGKGLLMVLVNLQ
ncbi:MAG: hypothetical protein ABI651_03580 [Verrucomicrobiota bacterium]